MMVNRRARPTPRARRRSEPGIVVKILLVAGFVAVVIIGFIVHNLYPPSPILRADGCRINNEPPPSKTVVLIDQTDRFSAVQVADITNRFNEVKQGIQQYGELVVYTIEESLPTLPSPVIRACNPGVGEDIDEMTESRIRAERKWRESFDAPLNKALSDFLAPTEGSASPIIETIQAVGVAEFGPVELNQTSKTLILISDLLQHSPVFSQYRGKMDFESFKKNRVYRRLNTDLRDVSVEIFYLSRTTKSDLQGPDHREFWKKFIEDQGAQVERLYSVSG